MGIETHLQNGSLRALFIEHLGWDHARGEVSVQVGGEQFALERIAQKRGFLVVRQVADRQRMQTRRFVKLVQREVAKIAHEHLLVIGDGKGEVQVWAWAYRDRSSGRLKHRLHPFFTAQVPGKLVERVRRLSVSLDEEERLTLSDVASRAKDVLDADAETEVFFRSPGYSERSYELAVRMRAGGEAELHAFVMFHEQLAVWFARRFANLTADREGIQQEAMVGLIRAAKKYDLERGTAFSTYAFHAMQRSCLYALPRLLPLGRIPDYQYWPIRRVQRRWEQGVARGGPDAGLDERDQAIEDEGLDQQVAAHLLRRLHKSPMPKRFRHISRRRMSARECTHSADGRERTKHPVTAVMRGELSEILDTAIALLPEEDQVVLRSRFGLNGPECTLEQVGQSLGVTRERVRQRERRALAWLKRWLLREYGPDMLPWALDEKKKSVSDEAHCERQDQQSHPG